jgi:o-succinylbenzoate synthase
MFISLLFDFCNNTSCLKKMKSIEHNIKLPIPLPIPNGVIYNRKIQLYEHDGCKFELSPLPGLSSESFEEAKSQIKPLLYQIERINNFEHFDLRRPLFNLLQVNVELYSSVLFCLEQYLFKKLNIVYGQNKLDTHHFIPNLKNIEYPQKANQFYKVKIGKYDVDFELEMIRTMLHDNPMIRLRLDANQAFEGQSLKPYLEFLSNIDYFEEPFINMALYDGLKIPVAIDESMPQILTLLENPHLDIKALVYKPTLMGGFSTAISLRLAPKLSSIPLVFSSCYEGKIGSTAIKQLATYSDFIGPKARHGLISIE